MLHTLQPKEANYTPGQSRKLDSLIFLRGLAVLLVCTNHFLSLLAPELDPVPNKIGRYGVHIFFVISGFVIPLSLYKGKYIIADYGRFLYKRFLRLHLPYVASVCLTYFIILLTFEVRHLHTDETVLSFVQTLFYAHMPTGNMVYWTLLVEIQYYFFIGLLFPFVLRYPVAVLLLFILLPCLSYRIFDPMAELPLNFLVHTPFFFIGIIGFMLYADMGNKVLNVLTATGLLCFVLYLNPFSDFISSLFTLLFILCYTFPVHKVLRFPGKISYSVYLIHFSPSYHFMGFMMMRTSEAFKPWLFFITLVIIFAAGYLFYLLFEVRSELWSAKITYRKGNYQLHQPVNEQSAGTIEEVTVQ